MQVAMAGSSQKNSVGSLSHTCTVVHSKLMVGYSYAAKIALKILIHRDFLPSFFLYNHFHKILRLFDVLLSFLFTTSETIPDYYL